MLKEIGDFAIHYTKNSQHVVIAFLPHPTCLSTHVALLNRLKGLVKPTGDYSYLSHKNNIYLGVHFNNTLPEKDLIQALKNS